MGEKRIKQEKKEGGYGKRGGKIGGKKKRDF